MPLDDLPVDPFAAPPDSEPVASPVAAPARAEVPALSAEQRRTLRAFGFDAIPEPIAPTQERSVLGDIGRGFAGSAASTGAAAIGAAEYVVGSGGTLTRWNEDLSAFAERMQRGLSPEMRRALEREFVPGSSGDPNAQSAWSSFGNFIGSAAAHMVGTSGSLVAAVPSLLAGLLATSPAGAAMAGAVVGAGVAGTLGAGTVWNDTAEAFGRLSPEQRMRNPTYARLIREGANEASAINETVRETSAQAIAIAGAGSAALGAVAGPFWGRLGGGHAGGVFRAAGVGARTEFLQEFFEEGLQQDQTQRARGLTEGRPYNWRETAEGAVRGGIAGGGLGGGAGAVGGAFARSQPSVQAGAPLPVDPAIAAAAAAAPIGSPPGAPPAPSVAPGAPSVAPAAPSVDPGLSAALAAQAPVAAPTPPAQAAGALTPAAAPGAPAPGPSQVATGVPPEALVPTGVPGPPGVAPTPPGAQSEAPPAPPPLPSVPAGDLRAAGLAVAEQNGLTKERNPVGRTHFMAGFNTASKNRPAVPNPSPEWEHGYATAQALLQGQPPPSRLAATAPPPVVPAAVASTPTDATVANTPPVQVATVEPTAPLTPVAATSLAPSTAEQGAAATPISGAALSVEKAAPSAVPSPPAAEGAVLTETAPTEPAPPAPKTPRAKKPKVAVPTPAAAPAARPRAVVDAVKAVRGELVSQARTALDRETGGAQANEIEDVVSAILRDAEAEIDAQGKSVSTIMSLILKRGREGIAQEVAKRQEAENKTTGGKKAPERISGPLVDDALSGKPGAQSTLIQHISANVPQDRLGDFYRRNLAKRVSKIGKAAPEWATKLRDIVMSGKQGGSAAQRAERTQQVEAWRAQYSAEEQARISATVAGNRDAVAQVFTDNTPAKGETIRDAATRMRAMSKAADTALGTTTLGGQLDLVGDDAASIARLQFLEKAGKLEGGSNTTGGTDTGTDKLIKDFRAVEAMIRAGDYTMSLELMSQTATEGRDVQAQGGETDPETDARADQADEGTNNVEDAMIASLDVKKLLAAGKRILPKAPASAPAPDTTGDSQGATESDVAAFRASREARLKAALPNIIKNGKASSVGSDSNDPTRSRQAAWRFFGEPPLGMIFADDPAVVSAVAESAGSLANDLYQDLLRKAGDVPVLIYPDAVFNSRMGSSGAGAFFANDPEAVRDGQLSGVIVIPESMVRDPALIYNGTANLREALSHELVHAGSYAEALIANTRTRERLQTLMDIVAKAAAVNNAVTPYTKRQINRLEYALQSPHEFLSMGLTNPEVKGILADIPISDTQRQRLGLLGTIQNALGALVEWVRQALKARPNTYSALYALIEIGAPALQNNEAMQTNLRAVVNPQLANMRGPLQLTGTLTAIKDVFTGVTPINETRGANWAQGLKRVGLGFSTMRQIELAHDKTFTRDARMNLIDPTSDASPMRQAATAHNRRAQHAQDRVTNSLEPVRALINLPPAGKERVSTLLLDATLAEAHPDDVLGAAGKNKHLVGNSVRQKQGRARHAALATRYNAMNAAEKAAYHKVLDTVRGEHKALVEAVMDRAIDLWWNHAVDQHIADPTANPLPILHGDIAALRQRAKSNTLTPADEQLLGDDTWTTLTNSRNRAKMQGPYVPLQRHGDFVVRWQENAPEFNTFATATDADAFIASTPYAAMDQKIKHYDAAGKEITRADPGILQIEIGVATSLLPANHTPQDRLAALRAAAKTAMTKTIARDSKRQEHIVKQQINGVSMFDRLSDANAFMREQREAGMQNVTQVALRDNPATRASMLKDADFEKMKSALERDTNLPPAARAEMINSLASAFMMVMPNRALNASLIKRRKVVGASKNLNRVLANYAIAVANFTATTEVSQDIITALKAMHDQTRDEAKNQNLPAGTTLARANVYQEMETRLLDSPVDAGGHGSTIPIIRKLQSLSYIYYLASPSYAMIQMTQPWLLSAPVLAARYGIGRGTRALSTAMADIGLGKVLGGGVKDMVSAMRALGTGQDTQPQPLLAFVKASLATKSDGVDLNRMLDALADEGIVDASAGVELIRSELTEEGFPSRKLAQTEALARAFPAAIEVVNRTSTAVATYRLARKAGKDHGQATLAAREVVDMTQADYSTSNTARYMDARRYPWIAPLMTFRKYAQAIYALVIRQAYLSVKGGTKEERREAFRTLSFTLGAHVAVAGVLGLPTEIFTLALGAAALLFGEGEPWDWEQEVRTVLADVFGPEIAEMIARGLPRGAGVDLSSRLGLNSLLFIKDLRDFEGRSMTEYMGSFLGGAPGNMLTAMLSAPKQIAEGQGRRAMEDLLPKGVRDAFRASRIANEGVTTRRGERIDSGRDPDAVETLVQALGFTPAYQAEVYERRNAVQSANRQLTQERTRLMRQWRQADPGDRSDAWERIVAWNERLGTEGREARITRANLISSLREATRRTQASGQADYLPANREFLRRRGEFANTRD